MLTSHRLARLLYSYMLRAALFLCALSCCSCYQALQLLPPSPHRPVAASASSLTRSPAVVMKRPYYIPRPEKNDKKWKPGDEPSASGFLEGFLQGFNFNKNQVKEREANAEEDAAQQRAEAEAAREWAEQQRAQGKDPTDLPRGI